VDPHHLENAEARAEVQRSLPARGGSARRWHLRRAQRGLRLAIRGYRDRAGLRRATRRRSTLHGEACALLGAASAAAVARQRRRLLRRRDHRAASRRRRRACDGEDSPPAAGDGAVEGLRNAGGSEDARAAGGSGASPPSSDATLDGPGRERVTTRPGVETLIL